MGIFIHEDIAFRIAQPNPTDIKSARMSAGLTQTQAAKLVSDAKTKAVNTWQGYEADESLAGHRAIPLAVWELFLLITDQHPTLHLSKRK